MTRSTTPGQLAFCGGLLEGGVQEAIATNPESLVATTISERMWLWPLHSRSMSREALAPGQGRVASAKDQHLLRWWDSAGSVHDVGPLPRYSRDDQLRTVPNLSASISTSAGDLAIGPLHSYTLDDIPRAHADLEHNRVFSWPVGVIDTVDVATTVQR